MQAKHYLMALTAGQYYIHEKGSQMKTSWMKMEIRRETDKSVQSYRY